MRSRFRVKPKTRSIVKALSIGLVLFTSTLYANEIDDDPTVQVAPIERRYEGLPDIEAKSYRVKVVRLSQSKRVYLFIAEVMAEVIAEGAEFPEVRDILLLRKGTTPTMAFRTLKIYPDRGQFAARKVRIYPPYENLGKGRAFQAFEKVADVFELPPETPEEIEKDEEDLEELEAQFEEEADTPVFDDFGEDIEKAEVDPINDTEIQDDVEEFDAELDAVPAPKPKTPRRDELESIIVEDPVIYDRDENWLSIGGGFFRNSQTLTGGTSYRAGFGGQYGVTIGRRTFFKTNRLQDSFVLEGGFFVYKVLNFVSSGDSYTVFPIIAKIRYNLMPSETTWFFAYAGLTKNGAIGGAKGSASQGDFERATAELASFVPSFGVGAIITIGPRWQVRADLGFDMIGAGLMLRF